MRELIEEAERWELETKPASLWWTSTYADEKTEDVMIMTKTGLRNLPSEKVGVLEYIFNLAGNMQAWRKGCRVRTKRGGEM